MGIKEFLLEVAIVNWNSWVCLPLQRCSNWNKAMDHRHSKRTNVQLSVLLYNNGVPVATGKTRNVSAGGVFVDTGYIPINGSRYMDIEFVTDNDAETDRYHVKGMAVHSTRDGIGLMIEDFDPESRLPTQMLTAGQR